MENYKDDIISSRVGCLGGSDAKMLHATAVAGSVPASFKKRLAVCKGLIEHENITTRAMQYGDYIEMMVYESLKAKDARWQSNPCLVSDKYSRKNVKCIDHVDLLLVDDEKKEITIGEVKASRYTTVEVRGEYKAQLAHHRLLGAEYARKLGNYKLKLMLCHYFMDGIDLDAPFTFDPSRLTVVGIKPTTLSYDLSKAMDIVNDYLETLDAYYESEEIDSMYLPDNVRDEFNAITNILKEIKEREQKVDEFKAKLATFMESHGVKSVKCPSWSITYVAPTQSVSVDYKAMAEKELFDGHPTRMRRLMEHYKKVTNKKSYVTIRTKETK